MWPAVSYTYIDVPLGLARRSDRDACLHELDRPRMFLGYKIQEGLCEGDFRSAARWNYIGKHQPPKQQAVSAVGDKC